MELKVGDKIKVFPDRGSSYIVEVIRTTKTMAIIENGIRLRRKTSFLGYCKQITKINSIWDHMGSSTYEIIKQIKDNRQ